MNFKSFSNIATAILWLLGGIILLPFIAHAAPDPNFHIYIAYGQSNMAGAGDIRKGVDDVEHERYKMFATTSCSALGRPTVGEIYPAIPPMFQCSEGLSIADWFGRYMADSLPDITIGVIPVAVGGTKIELFDKDKYKSYLSTAESWLQNWAKSYGSDGNAHARIVEVAKKAMEVGVIKGFIFHQGESGAMSGNNWQQEVKKTRDDILTALNLSADTVPFLAGEMEDNAAGGCCYSFALNNVGNLPNIMENTYVVKSTGLKGNGKDSYHFCSESYQEFGLRYAQKMLEVMNKAPAVLVPRAPFGGSAAKIPGKIQAENFDIPGTANKTYNEVDTKNHGDSEYRNDTGVDLYKKATGIIVGYNQKDEWLEYTVDITDAGDYTMFAAVASANGTSSFKLSLDGSDITETIVPPKNSGEENYDDYNKVQANITLPKGEHILRFTVMSDWIDVDYFTFVKGANALDNEPIQNSETETKEDTNVQTIFANNLHFATEAETSFSLFDLKGNRIATIKILSASEAINIVKSGAITQLKKGVYYIQSKKFSKAIIYEK